MRICFLFLGKNIFLLLCIELGWLLFKGLYRGGVNIQLIIIKDLFFNEINLLTEDKHKESGLYMISSIAQLKDN